MLSQIISKVIKLGPFLLYPFSTCQKMTCGIWIGISNNWTKGFSGEYGLITG